MSIRRGVAPHLLGMAAAVVLSSAGPVAAADFRLSMSSDDTHPNTIAVNEMVKEIAKKTNGAVNIKVFSNNVLGSPPETTEQARLGVIEFAVLSPSQLDKFNRAFGVVMIPYQFDDYAHAYKTLDETAWDWFQAKAHDIGFEIVANFEWGFRALSNSKRPIMTPEDVKGMKLRVPPEIQIKASMEALGAITQTIAFPEVYMALANKVVDGQDNPIPTDYSQKFFEVQSTIALTKHVYNNMILVANKKAWETKLDDAQRKIISEEAVKYGNKARQTVQDKEKWYVGEMEKAGVKFTYPKVADFRAVMKPAYATVKDYVGEKNWNEWQKLVEAAH
jgi:tripartite ATP-independent transporter DctP family solute receptor